MKRRHCVFEDAPLSRQGLTLDPREAIGRVLTISWETRSRLDGVYTLTASLLCSEWPTKNLMVSDVGNPSLLLDPATEYAQSHQRRSYDGSLLVREVVRFLCLSLTRSRPVTGSCTHLDCAFAGTHDLQAVCLQRFRSISSATVDLSGSGHVGHDERFRM